MSNGDMRIGIMQPYFMPYIGYFQLMAAVDKYVIFDDVNFIMRGWSTKNYLVINGEKRYFSISVRGKSQNKTYSQVLIIDDFYKLRRTLEINYKKAPYHTETMELLDKVFTFEDRRFNYFVKNSFDVICAYLGISTEFVFSSDLSNDKTLKGKDKVLDICKLLGATDYYNAIGGQELYDKKEFAENGIRLHFVNTIQKAYPQLSTEFVPDLSIIDVLMMNSREDIKTLLRMFVLV